VANCKELLVHYIGLKKYLSLYLSLSLSHTHTHTHTHTYAENFIWAAMYCCVMRSRWHTTDLHVATLIAVGSSWNVMEHGDAGEGKWRGNWQMEWVATVAQRLASQYNIHQCQVTGARKWQLTSRWRHPAY